MKTRFLLFLFCEILVPLFASSQTHKKPTLMILPSDNWCTQRYFVMTFNNQGDEIEIPNYHQAFLEDTELCAVISKIGSIMTDLGYSLKDSEQELKNITIRSAEDNVTTSKNSGASILESPLDIIKRRVKADIIIQVWWKINKEGSKKSVTFTLEAFDTYTSKRIATSTGTSKTSNDIVPILLEETVRARIKAFDKQLTMYYESMEQSGREIVLTLKCWDNWECDLEEEYDGIELLEHIQNWLHQNSVNGQFNLTDATENFAQFEQVHIPLMDNKGRAIDARAFASDLRKYLKQPPFEITSKVMVRGLGEAIIVLGEK